MSFAGHYLEKHALFSPFIPEFPHPDLFISIVIPCFDEPDLLKTLNSIWNCERPDSAVEVIVVINSSINAPESSINQNLLTLRSFIDWNIYHLDEKLKFFVVFKDDLPEKDAGVGLSRKIGMDEALRRFAYLERPDGIIVGFDADSTCSENYLVELENHFKSDRNLTGCSIHFEHPLGGSEHSEFIYNAVIQYELYLRYYIQALRNINYPFAFHTIGSSFAVRAEVYAKQGGMNKRKAGEDFYFLQKVIPLGNFSELKKAVVYPSPRTSTRVPFGTGAAILKMESKGDYNYKTYDYKAFDDLSLLVNNVEQFFIWNEDQLISVLQNLKKPLQSFLTENEFVLQVAEIKKNSTSLKTFSVRFFKWFNAFKVLKYMNYSHAESYKLRSVLEVASELLNHVNVERDLNPKDLLSMYRDIQK